MFDKNKLFLKKKKKTITNDEIFYFIKVLFLFLTKRITFKQKKQ